MNANLIDDVIKALGGAARGGVKVVRAEKVLRVAASKAVYLAVDSGTVKIAQKGINEAAVFGDLASKGLTLVIKHCEANKNPRDLTFSVYKNFPGAVDTATYLGEMSVKLSAPPRVCLNLILLSIFGLAPLRKKK